MLMAVVAALSLAMGLSLPESAHAARAKGPVLTSPNSNAITNHPDMRWTAVPGAVEYTVEVAQDRRFATKPFIYTTSATRYIPQHTLPAASYWWRVRVSQPFTSQWSSKRAFTRRWLVPDASTGRQEVARPDSVRIEDYSSTPGYQAPINAIQVSWDPVADASFYVVQFDFVKDADPDLVPPYDAHENFDPADATCITPHSVLTPNISAAGLPEQGVSLIADPQSQVCQVTRQGLWAVRVRAVDVTTTGAELYSLWSDEARSPDQAAPGATMFLLATRLPEDATRTPAVLTTPANKSTFTDAPVMSWNPKAIGGPSTLTPDPNNSTYKVVISLDADFTTEVGHFWTTNTRFVPTERFPEDNAERAYYWYVVPCDEYGQCIAANQVVNRPSVYRTFIKLSPRPQTRRADRISGPFAMFGWTSVTRTARHLSQATDSVAGTDYYEFQTRLPGRQWETETGLTDVPQYLPSDLMFNTRYLWRVRVVDGSGQPRPWSAARSVKTPAAAPANPPRLRAARRNGRVTLTWGTPASRYFPVDSYSIFYSLNGKRWKPLGTTGGLRAAYRVKNKTRYWFSVTANSRGGSSSPSRVVVGK